MVTGRQTLSLRSSAVRGCRIWTVDNATCSSDFKLQKYSVHVSQCFHGLSQLFVPAIPQQSGSPLAGYGQHPKAPGSLATGYPMLNMPGSPSTNKIGGVNSTPLGLNSGYYAGYEHNVMASAILEDVKGSVIDSVNRFHKFTASFARGKAHKQKELMSKGGTVQNLSRNKVTFKCDVCQVMCSAQDAYDAHVKGAKHQKTIATMKKMGQSFRLRNPLLFLLMQESQGTESNMNLVGLEFIEEINGVREKLLTNASSATAHKIQYKIKINPTLKVEVKTPYGSSKSEVVQVIILIHRKRTTIRQQPQCLESSDDRHVVAKNESLLPSKTDMDLIEKLVSMIERTLKNISDKWAEEDKAALVGADAEKDASTTEPTETTDPERLLKGVMRVGLMAKNLLLSDDKEVNLLVLCSKFRQSH
uniref:DZF domain-containing protein n=1 Tax=Ditylenchus dipsaci TaxID=166011 RepID=A0A915E439_9BILA